MDIYTGHSTVQATGLDRMQPGGTPVAACIVYDTYM